MDARLTARMEHVSVLLTSEGRCSMGIPAQRDLDKTRAAVRQWITPKLAELSAAGLGADGELSEFSAPNGSGYSNETLLTDVTWTAGGIPQSERLVVRI